MHPQLRRLWRSRGQCHFLQMHQHAEQEIRVLGGKEIPYTGSCDKCYSVEMVHFSFLIRYYLLISQVRA